MALKYIQQNTEANKSIKYPSSSHPYVKGKSGCVYTSGCGVCTSLMILENGTTKTRKIKTWTNKLIALGARAPGGTNLNVVAKHLVNKFGFTFSTTTSKEKLRAHLATGSHAIANVGANNLFSSGGHYVFLGGIKNDTKEIIVLDPYYYAGKFTNVAKRKKAIKYNAKTNEAYVSLDDLHKDTKGLKYYLFTPTRNINLKYSAVSEVAAQIKAKEEAKKKAEAAAKKKAEEAAKKKAEEDAKKKAAEAAKKKAAAKKEVLLNYQVKKQVSVVNVRTGAGTKNKVLRTYKGNAKISVVKGGKVFKNGLWWFKVKTNKGYGYMARKYLKKAAK